MFATKRLGSARANRTCRASYVTSAKPASSRSLSDVHHVTVTGRAARVRFATTRRDDVNVKLAWADCNAISARMVTTVSVTMGVKVSEGRRGSGMNDLRELISVLLLCICYFLTECDTCPGPHYICDQTTGRCVCPPNSHGPDCQHCEPKSWGWQPRTGCKKCECDAKGSIGSCDPITGQCQCREGFIGKNCDQCAGDHFGYPNCTRCNCDEKGSLTSDCDHLGQCRCKELVTGLKCDQCRQATFGLSKTNQEGCTRCYCFGRSQECTQSVLSWGQIRQIGSRKVTVEYVTPLRRNSEQDLESVVVVELDGSQMTNVDSNIEVANDLHLLPSSTGNISIESYVHFEHPLYFQLPKQFLGNKVSSYAGHLQFTLASERCNRTMPLEVLEQYPLVQIHSYDDLVLDYFGVRC